MLNRALVRANKPYPPGSVEELEILPGVAEGLCELKAAGFLLIVVSNQPDVARGTVARHTVEDINQALAAALPIDEFRTCYHDSLDHCHCRKPKPGMDVAEIWGRFDGELTVRQQLIVHPTGSVSGNVKYARIRIEEGGEISGEISTLRGASAGERPSATIEPLKSVAAGGK